MIAHDQIPDADGKPGRAIWVAMMYAVHLGKWRPISKHGTAIDAAEACVRAFQPAWLDIQEQARILRALIGHPEIAAFVGKEIDGQMLARRARGLCEAIDAQDLSVARLLDAPQQDDELDDDFDELDDSPVDGHIIDETVLRILDAIETAPEIVTDMLARVHETTPNQLPLVLMGMTAHLAYPGRALHLMWHKPLSAFMRIAYRLRASTAALNMQPVGSYLDFCARVIARSQFTETVALRLLQRCQPDEMNWDDYVASLPEPQPDGADELDDETIVHFGDHKSDIDDMDVEPMLAAQSMVSLLIEQQRQHDDGERNFATPLIFLAPELARSEEPLPQDVADNLFIQLVRRSVERVHQHQGTLISPSAIAQASKMAHDTLRTLTGQAGVVPEPKKHASVQVAPRDEKSADNAKVITLASVSDTDDEPLPSSGGDADDSSDRQATQDSARLPGDEDSP